MEPGKMRVSELILLYYAIRDVVKDELPSELIDDEVSLGAVFADHLVSLKTKPFTGTAKKTETIGSLLTPIFQHFGIRLDQSTVVTTRSLMDEAYLRSTKWLKEGLRWSFRDDQGHHLIPLPQRELTTLRGDHLQLEFRPDHRLLVGDVAPRLRRGTSSRAIPSSGEDDSVDLAGGRSAPLPAFPAAPDLPSPDPFQRYVMDALQAIWGAVSSCRCMRPPRPRTPSPPPASEDLDEDLDEA